MLFGCDREDAWDLLKTRGDAVVEQIELPAFNAITVYNDINVVLTKGNAYNATVEGWKNLMPKINLSVDDNGALMIEDKNSFNFVRSRDNMTTVNLTYADELNAITFSGNGYFMSDDVINTSSLSILCQHASGSIDLTVITATLGIGANSGNTASVTIAGEAASVGITNWGFGPINLLALKASAADIHHHGMGNTFINASETLSVTLYGVGNVYYTGNPSITLVSKGKGSLLKN